MLRTKTNLHYAASAAQADAVAPVYDCDACGHPMALYRVVFANGSVHFASRCQCGQRYWPQTAATAAYWADAPLVPSKKFARKRAAAAMCRAIRGVETLDAQCDQAIDRDR